MGATGIDIAKPPIARVSIHAPVMGATADPG